MSRLLTALLVVLLARPDAMLAQAAASTAPMLPGARVRITQIGEQPRVAVVVARSADTLLVRWREHAKTVAVPLAEISRLEISSGQHRNVVKGIALGTLTGGTVGALLGAAIYSPCTSNEAFGCMMAPASAGESTAL